MTLRTGRPRLAALLVLGLLLSWLGLPPVAVPPAFAAFTGCGSDPVVSLSNGAQLDL